ncbi:uncharacterized protein A4U43_C03F20980 [Asparagus officinalis]|uniref:Uncharacterized protein n=1 Tax=Asparagus officinalis TaxID=4686 RepID=A0A5P1FEK6_ASPOF|nr:uncharacterized protein A4U43_C03F20980 [Asparagus officinalis]
MAHRRACSCPAFLSMRTASTPPSPASPRRPLPPASPTTATRRFLPASFGSTAGGEPRGASSPPPRACYGPGGVCGRLGARGRPAVVKAVEIDDDDIFLFLFFSFPVVKMGPNEADVAMQTHRLAVAEPRF